MSPTNFKGKTMSNLLYDESIDVYYEFEPREGLKKFDYTAKNLLHNIAIPRTVYCYNSEDFVKLIDCWNDISLITDIRHWEYMIIENKGVDQ